MWQVFVLRTHYPRKDHDRNKAASTHKLEAELERIELLLQQRVDGLHRRRHQVQDALALQLRQQAAAREQPARVPLRVLQPARCANEQGRRSRG